MLEDYNVCSKCLMVLGTQDGELLVENCCGNPYRSLMSWWVLREYAPYLPLQPIIGKKYELKSITLSPADIVHLITETCEDSLNLKHNTDAQLQLYLNGIKNGWGFRCEKADSLLAARNLVAPLI